MHVAYVFMSLAWKGFSSQIPMHYTIIIIFQEDSTTSPLSPFQDQGVETPQPSGLTPMGTNASLLCLILLHGNCSIIFLLLGKQLEINAEKLTPEIWTYKWNI